MYVLAVHAYILWRKVYSNPLSIFKLGYLLLLNCKCPLYILDLNPLDLNPLSVVGLTSIIISPILCVVFSLCYWCLLWSIKFYFFMKFRLSVFSLVVCGFCVLIQNHDWGLSFHGCLINTSLPKIEIRKLFFQPLLTAWHRHTI